MKDFHQTVNWKIQQGGVLLLAGLFAIFFTLFWVHALSFVVFAGVGALLCLAGVFMYVLWLIS